MTSLVRVLPVGRRPCLLVVVVMTLTVAWSSALQTKHRAAAPAATDGREVDLDRPAVDDPSAAIVANPTASAAVLSKSDVDGAIERQPVRSRHRSHRHRGSSGSLHRSEPVKSADVSAKSRSAGPTDDDADGRGTSGDSRRRNVDETAESLAADVADSGVVARATDNVSDDGEEVHPVAPVAELENVVVDLRAQLKESHATHMHTRSVINVLQERQEAQERDMAVMKDDIARLQRDLATERDLVKALKAQSADSAWAIADVKRGQDQAASDLAALKRLQEQQNETMYLVEELMMSNAVEIIGHNKHAVAVRHEIAQLQTEAANDRRRVGQLDDQLQQHVTAHDSLHSRQWGEEDNTIDEDDDFDEMTSSVQQYGKPNHRRRPERHVVAAASSRSVDEDGERSVLDVESNFTAGTGRASWDTRRRHSADSGELSSVESLSTIKTRLDKHDEEFARLDARVTEMDSRVSRQQLAPPTAPSHRHSPDGDTIAVGAELLQQAFVNFTKHIYGLEETWRQQTLEHNGLGVDLRSTTLIDEQPTSISVDRRLSALNASIADARSAAESSRVRTDAALVGVDRRLAELAAAIGERDSRQRHLELLVSNRSLEQCQRTNTELMSDLRAAQLVEKVAGIERQLGEQTTNAARTENALSVINQEIRRHTDSITSLSKQAKLLRHLPSEVSALQADLRNVVTQLPTDCTAAMGPPSSRRPDGVYLIRPPSGSMPTRAGRPTIRVQCQRDTADPSTVWMVIQRRSDGRESFARGWNDYRAGFGDPTGEHWLGNDHIARLTSSTAPAASSTVDDVGTAQRTGVTGESGTSTAYRLRVDMWDVRGRYWVAEYPSFRVRGSDDLYRLELGDVDPEVASTKENSVDAGGVGGIFVGAGDGPNSVGSMSGGSTRKTGGFTGNATDALRYSDRQSFSAVDRDNDVSTTDCARFYAAGWWYKHCHYANLNGRYTSGIVWFNEDIDEWLQMRQTVMKIAPASTSSSASGSNIDNDHSTYQSSVHHDVINSPNGGAITGGSHRNKSKAKSQIKEPSSLSSSLSSSTSNG